MKQVVLQMRREKTGIITSTVKATTAETPNWLSADFQSFHTVLEKIL